MPDPFIMFWYIIAMAFGSNPPPPPIMPIPPPCCCWLLKPRPPPGALKFLTKLPEPLG